MRVLVLFLFLAEGAAFAQQPRIDKVIPAAGPIAGGTLVTISGTNFGGATVRIDRASASTLLHTDSEIQLRTKPHGNGYAVISVETPVGTARSEFLYLPPRLEEILPGHITTVAGVGSYIRTFGRADRVSVMPLAIAYDAAGNLYVSEPGQHRVTRIDPAGEIHEFAGGNFYTGDIVADDVPAIDGGVAFPWGVAVGPRGDVYVGTHCPLLRRIDPLTGRIHNVAGSNIVGFSGDGGPARTAKSGQVTALAANASAVYFLDWENARIRRVDADGRIVTVAGNGTAGSTGDGGPATQASFFFGNPDEGAIALDPQGNLFIADSQNHAIRRVDAGSGFITRFYSPPDLFTAPDFAGVVRSLACDASGNLYYGGGGRIVKLSPSGQFLQSWGQGHYGFTEDGPLTPDLEIGLIMGLAIDPSGSIVFTDAGRVRRLDLSNDRLETIAGIYPAYQDENGPALAAPIMDDNMDIAVREDGTLLIGDFRLRRLGRDASLLTIAGSRPDPGFRNVVPADEMNNPCLAIEVLPDGRIDVAGPGPIGQLGTDGVYRALGPRSGDCGFEGDGGPLHAALLCQPWDAVRDRAGNMLIADTNNNRIRRVDAQTGTVTTLAGAGGPVSGIEGYGRGSFCGDGGPALSACLNTPYGLAVDTDGSIYVSENWSRVRRIAPDGKISTFAEASGGISKLVFGPGGYLYATGSVQAGRYDRSGDFHPLAGNGQRGFSGDGGPALQASIDSGGQSAGVAVDAEGNFYFQDSMNRRIRAVRYGAVLPPEGAKLSASAEGTVLRFKVRDSSNRPAPGVRLDFDAPLSGATCRLSAAFAITGADGTAIVDCTPNCIGGAYAVTARPVSGPAQGSVTLTNPPEPCRRRGVRH